MNTFIFKKVCIFLILLLVLSISGCSSNNNQSSTYSVFYTISGTITDTSSNPLADVLVNLGTSSANTDSNGFYQFTNISAGNYTLSIYADNYSSYQEEIEVSQDLIRDFSLDYYNGGGLIKGKIEYKNTSLDYSVSQVAVKKDSLLTTNTGLIPEYRENEILVKYSSGTEAVAIKRENNLTKIGVSQSFLDKGIIVHYQLPEESDLEDILAKFQSLAEVEWAQPNYIYQLSGIPNDNYYPQQWGHHKINLEGARDYFSADKTVTVAVIDTGIIPDHPDLADRIIPGGDFVGEIDESFPYDMTDDVPADETRNPERSHGSHVAGIIAASTDNNQGIAGVYGQIDILPVRVFDRFGNGEIIDIVEGINYAIKMEVDIINLSMGGIIYSQLLHEVIQQAVEQDIVVIASTGNSGGSVMYPGALPEVIAVGSINSQSVLSDFSCYGSEMELVAPGEVIISSTGYMHLDGSFYSDYANMSGTSMAAPYVSGVAALLKASGLAGTEIRNRLNSTAFDLGDKGWDERYGYGLVDAYAALRGESMSTADVFAATIEGNIVSLKSPSGYWDNEKYTVQSPPGEYYLVAFRDLNNNEIIDTGDYFGKSTDTIIVQDSEEINKDISLYYVDDNSVYNGMNIVYLD